MTIQNRQHVNLVVTDEIRQCDALTDEEKHRLYGWGKDIFGADSLNLRWRPKDLHFLIDRGGRSASHVGVLKHSVSIDGRSVLIGGVGGVVTVPEAQRQGLARRLMEYAARFFEEEWQVDAGLLFCMPRMVAYYEDLGWRAFDGPVTIQQPQGEILSPMGIMLLPVMKDVRAGKAVDLMSYPW